MAHFIHENFLLNSDPARELYHDHAAHMPIYDFHCHLPPGEIAEDRQYSSISEIWLHGDHYKWRAMRTNGVPEERITGGADDRDKFQAWAETVPATLGNPLYHWTHMELANPFGIHKLLNPESAEEIWQQTGELLADPSFSVRSLLKRRDVRLVCTTDDPVDDLAHHAKLASDQEVHTKVVPGFRPDKALGIAAEGFREYLSRLGAAANVEIRDLATLKSALVSRVEHFHNTGCRISDHALTVPVARELPESEVERIFSRAIAGEHVSEEDAEAYTTHVLAFLAREYHARSWTMQLHIGALRNNNTRMFEQLGPDSGFDSMADGAIGRPLARFLDLLDREDTLPRTILYILNPRDNELIASITGCFQDGRTPGKIQFGPAWWFNDQIDGMTRHLRQVASINLLSRFIGMLTDSRSFLSFARHEYFRRLLCDIIGGWVVSGELPHDKALLGSLVEDICWNNAKNYFGIEVPE